MRLLAILFYCTVVPISTYVNLGSGDILIMQCNMLNVRFVLSEWCRFVFLFAFPH
jgi:hypothetical protein